MFANNFFRKCSSTCSGQVWWLMILGQMVQSSVWLQTFVIPQLMAWIYIVNQQEKKGIHSNTLTIEMSPSSF